MNRLVVLCVALFTASCVPARPEPETRRMKSDAEMIALFGQERASFDSLVTMLGEDEGIRYLDDYGRDVADHGDFVLRRDYAERMPAGISAERWDAYERLLRRVHVGRFVRKQGTRIRFEQYVAWDYVRGYEYSPDSDRDPGTRYRSLGGGWSLFSLPRTED